MLKEVSRNVVSNAENFEKNGLQILEFARLTSRIASFLGFQCSLIWVTKKP